MTFSPTPEQLAIISAATDTTDNLLIPALAGAAKTTTLEMVATALSPLEMLYLVFNKKMAVEADARMPSNVRVMTLNSLGHRIWSEATGRRLKIDAGKTYGLVSAYIENIEDKKEQRELYNSMGELMRLVGFGKACGYIPTGAYEERAKRLMGDEFFDAIPEKLSQAEIDCVRTVTLQSLKLAFEGQCDYDDQILMPTVFHGAFPRYPLVLIDEAQDLSALNHATLRKLVKKRLIAVGDPNQAIYGFRGAHEESMEKLRQEFDMKELGLSISFRCPRAIVSHAHFKTPQMRWPEWAKEGSVTTKSYWSHKDLPDSAAILCRNNAPLFSIAIKLLTAGRSCEIEGKDVVKALTKIMRKFGDHTTRAVDVLSRIDQWEEEQLAKVRKRGQDGVRDRAQCMRVFARHGDNLGDILAYAQHITQLYSPLKLLTVHKAKGLEYDHVYILDEFLIGTEDQEPNLRYVGITRAKETLTYITSENFCHAGLLHESSDS